MKTLMVCSRYRWLFFCSFRNPELQRVGNLRSFSLYTLGRSAAPTSAISSSMLCSLSGFGTSPSVKPRIHRPQLYRSPPRPRSPAPPWWRRSACGTQRNSTSLQLSRKSATDTRRFHSLDEDIIRGRYRNIRFTISGMANLPNIKMSYRVAAFLRVCLLFPHCWEQRRRC